MSYMCDMKTLSIRIDDEVKARWEELAKAHGLNPSQHMRDAIIDRLEELEEYYVVMERVSKPYETIPHEEILKQFGLNDVADED